MMHWSRSCYPCSWSIRLIYLETTWNSETVPNDHHRWCLLRHSVRWMSAVVSETRRHIDWSLGCHSERLEPSRTREMNKQSWTDALCFILLFFLISRVLFMKVTQPKSTTVLMILINVSLTIRTRTRLSLLKAKPEKSVYRILFP